MQYPRLKNHLTTCHSPSFMNLPPLVTLKAWWFLNWTSMRPPLSPNMNHEWLEDSAYRITPSGSNVRKSNSAANLEGESRQEEDLSFRPACVSSCGMRKNKNQSLCTQWKSRELHCNPTLCFQVGGNEARWRDDPQTAPPGKASQDVCSRSGPRRWELSRSIGHPPPGAILRDHRRCTCSCLLCSHMSHHTKRAHTHSHLQQTRKQRVKNSQLTFPCVKMMQITFGNKEPTDHITRFTCLSAEASWTDFVMQRAC